MKELRWFRTYNSNGEKTEWELQYWSDFYSRWKTIPFIECSEKDEDEYLHTLIIP